MNKEQKEQLKKEESKHLEIRLNRLENEISKLQEEYKEKLQRLETEKDVIDFKLDILKQYKSNG